ncbi:MAG: hypothetical protein ACK5K7_01865 [Bacilli bacterium]
MKLKLILISLLLLFNFSNNIINSEEIANDFVYGTIIDGEKDLPIYNFKIDLLDVNGNVIAEGETNRKGEYLLIGASKNEVVQLRLTIDNKVSFQEVLYELKRGRKVNITIFSEKVVILDEDEEETTILMEEKQDSFNKDSYFLENNNSSFSGVFVSIIFSVIIILLLVTFLIFVYTFIYYGKINTRIKYILNFIKKNKE